MSDEIKAPDALSEASTEDLIDELLHRFDHAGFIGVRVAVAPKENQYVRRWVGNDHMVMGLCADLANVALAEHVEAEEPLAGDGGDGAEVDTE